jgi:hypothetical protein
MRFTRVAIVLTSLFAMLLPIVAAKAASSQIEIVSISEISDSSVEILFNSSLSKNSPAYYVVNGAIELPVAAPQDSKTQNVVAIRPKNINKVIKTKATGLITAQIKNLNPMAAYKFSISAKTNKGKTISSAPVDYSPLSNLMDLLSNLPADWGNPKPIQLPTPAPTSAPVALPAFTLSSTTESLTVNTAATGFTINSTGGAIASFAINATPAGMSFNTTTGALTGTPNTIATATTYTISATNSSGSATQTFTLTVNAKVTPSLSIFADVSKASGAPAFTLTAPTVAGSLSGAFTYTSATTATATIAGATVTVVSGGTTLITATFTPTDTANYNNATITMTLTVAYAVGDPGPGGGFVYYVSATNFTSTGSPCNTSCKYLEVAPADEARYFADEANQGTTVSGAKGTAIGTGFQNSVDIANQSGNTSAGSAAVYAREYRGGSLTDWYLPSRNELNQLCKWARGQNWVSDATPCNSSGSINSGRGASGFGSTFYWSSTDWFQPYAYSQGFSNGGQNANSKNNGFPFRPIRAF